MEKEKMKLGKKILIVIGIVLAIFVLHMIRNMLIFRSLDNKVNQYINSSNYYKKITYYKPSNTIPLQLFETYKKDDKYFTTMDVISTDEGNRKIKNYCDGEKVNIYIETEDSKVAMLNEGNAIFARSTVGSLSEMFYLTENKNLDFIRISAFSTVVSERFNGKDCYKIVCRMSPTNLHYGIIYVEKNTGLILRWLCGNVDSFGENNEALTDYSYSFNIVTDRVFEEPDISEYEVQNNNISE